MIEENNILTSINNNIGIITLNQPERRNTFDVPLARALNDALWEFEKNKKVNIVIIRNTGRR